MSTQNSKTEEQQDADAAEQQSNQPHRKIGEHTSEIVIVDDRPPIYNRAIRDTG